MVDIRASYVLGGFVSIFVYFLPGSLGKIDSHFDEHIFSDGLSWFNHQAVLPSLDLMNEWIFHKWLGTGKRVSFCLEHMVSLGYPCLRSWVCLDGDF